MTISMMFLYILNVMCDDSGAKDDDLRQNCSISSTLPNSTANEAYGVDTSFSIMSNDTGRLTYA